jgi:hypothetical protein
MLDDQGTAVLRASIQAGMENLALMGYTGEELQVLDRLERCGARMIMSARLMNQDDDCMEKTRRAIESSTARIRNSDAHIDRLRPWHQVTLDKAAPPRVKGSLLMIETRPPNGHAESVLAETLGRAIDLWARGTITCRSTSSSSQPGCACDTRES